MSQRGKFLKRMKEAIELAHAIEIQANALNDTDSKWVEYKLKKWCKEMGYKGIDDEPLKPTQGILLNDDLPF